MLSLVHKASIIVKCHNLENLNAWLFHSLAAVEWIHWDALSQPPLLNQFPLFINISSHHLFFGFVHDIFWICPWYFLDLSMIFFGFVPDIFWFSQQLLCISQHNFWISWPFFSHFCCLSFQLTTSLRGSPKLSVRRATNWKLGPRGPLNF